MNELMTLEELAIYLRVTEKTIHRLIEKRAIPTMRVGRQWRFDHASIDAWLHLSAPSRSVKILVIDDDETICSLFRDTLEATGHSVTAITESTEGLEQVRKNDFDAIFLDLKMPVIDGVEVFRQIKTIKPELPVTIITGYPDSNLMMAALAYGPFSVMKKPFTASDILIALNNYLRLGLPVK